MCWHEQKAWTHHKIAVKGKAGVSKAWCDRNGNPPAYILVRPKGVRRRPVVLHTFVRQGDDENEYLVLTQEQLIDVAPDHVLDPIVDVEYRTASLWARLWYTGTLFVIFADSAGCLSLVVAATFAYLRYTGETSRAQKGTSATTTDPLLGLALVVLVVAIVAATAKLIKDVRERRK